MSDNEPSRHVRRCPLQAKFVLFLFQSPQNPRIFFPRRIYFGQFLPGGAILPRRLTYHGFLKLACFWNFRLANERRYRPEPVIKSSNFPLDRFMGSWGFSKYKVLPSVSGPQHADHPRCKIKPRLLIARNCGFSFVQQCPLKHISIHKIWGSFLGVKNTITISNMLILLYKNQYYRFSWNTILYI